MKKGFTLIELLVVVVILGIGAAIMLSVLQTSSLKRSRDTKRLSDIKQYQIALENYATNNSATYPTETTPVRLASEVCSDLGDLVQNCLEDPWYSKDGSPADCSGMEHTYCYSSDGTKWVMWTKMEILTSDDSERYWVICSTRKSGYVNNLTSQSSGTCPL